MQIHSCGRSTDRRFILLGFCKIQKMAFKLLSLRRLSTFLKPHFSTPSTSSCSSKFHQLIPLLLGTSRALHRYPYSANLPCCSSASFRDFCSEGPAAIDYRSVFQCYISFLFVLDNWLFFFGCWALEELYRGNYWLMTIDVDTVLFYRKMNFTNLLI